MANSADGHIIIDLQLQQDEFEKRLNELESKTSSFGNKIKKILLSIGIGAMAKKVASYIYDVGSSFEETMSKVQAISGATAEELEKLTAKAKEMGSKTKFSASEAGAAFTYMAMAGWKTADMLNGIEGIMNLAAASGEDLASVSDIVTDALTAFGLSAKDSAHFADVLAKASSSSNTNVALMGETFKYVAPVAGALGYGIEDTAVAIGLMANAGIKGSQAGTALRSILSRMAKPTKTVAEAMDALGLSLTNKNGSMKSLDQIMKDLRKSFSNLSEAQKAEMAASLGGQEAMSGLLAIVSASDKDFEALVNQINNADGAAEEMSNTMINNLKGSLTIMKSALEGIGISLYEKVSPALKSFVDFITNDVLSAISELINGDFSKIKEYIPIVESLTIAFVGLKGALELNKAINTFKKMKDGLLAWQMATRGTAVSTGLLNGQLTIGQGLWALLTGQMTLSELATYAQAKAMGVLNSVMNANPIALVVAAIAVLAAGFIYLWNTSEEFRNFWISLWNDMCSFFMESWGYINSFFTETIPQAFNDLKSKINDICNNIVQFFKDSWNSIITFFTETIPSWINSVIEWFNQLPYYLGYAIGQAIGHIIQFGIDLYNFVTIDIPNFVNSVISWFEQLPDRIWSLLVRAYNNVKTWGNNVYTSARDWISKTVDDIVSYFSSLPGKIWNWLVDSTNKVIKWGSNLYIKGKEAAGKLADSVINGIKGLPSQMASIGNDIVEGLWNGINDMGAWIGKKIKSFGSGVLDGIKDFFGIHSPSKIMADEVGKYLPKGLVVGFEAEMHDTNRDIRANARSIVDNFQNEVNDTVTKNQNNGSYNPQPYNDHGNNGVIDYTRLGNEVANAISKSNLKVKVNNKDFGRVVKEVVK